MLSLKNKSPAFSWAPFASIQYLGIQLTSPSSRILFLNYATLIAKLTQTCTKLCSITTYWAGRISLSKMFLLPHILYIFQMSPLPFIPAQLGKIQSILHASIWQANKTRIKMSILHRPSALARMGAPNSTQYYKSTILAQLRNWWNTSQHLPWLQI